MTTMTIPIQSRCSGSTSLAYTKWMCKYNIVFTPKHRGKEIYNQVRRNLIEIFKRLCKYKGVEIIGYGRVVIILSEQVLVPSQGEELVPIA